MLQVCQWAPLAGRTVLQTTQLEVFVIGRLTGDLVGEDADGTILLDVGGVGYELFTPLGTVGRLREPSADTGRPRLTLHVHTHVREDALTLYGFASIEDKSAFRALISVASVGPKTALAVLSALPAHELASALERRDIAKLVSVPGIGRKTAERLLLELKGKLAPLATPGANAGAGHPEGAREPAKEEMLTQALIGLGYRPAEADRAIQQLRSRLETHAVPELIREALALLAR